MDSQTDRRRLESFCLDGMIENGSTPQTPENRLNENFTKKEFRNSGIASTTNMPIR